MWQLAINRICITVSNEAIVENKLNVPPTRSTRTLAIVKVKLKL